jgi:hypothetical protein
LKEQLSRKEILRISVVFFLPRIIRKTNSIFLMEKQEDENPEAK